MNDDRADWREAWAQFPGDGAHVWHGARHAARVAESLVDSAAAVLTAEQVAGSFGIGRRTFYSMMAHDEEIAARYKGRKAIGVIAQGLINKARGGDTASMIFFLKTQAGWREAEEPGAVERLRTFLDVIAQRHNVAATLIARPLADGGVKLSVEDGNGPNAGNPP